MAMEKPVSTYFEFDATPVVLCTAATIICRPAISLENVSEQYGADGHTLYSAKNIPFVQ